MRKIYDFFIKYTPREDYLSHFYWGSLYSFFVGVPLYVIFNLKIFLLVPAFLAGLIKEFFDGRGNGKVEFLDFVFTFIPAILILVTLIL